MSLPTAERFERHRRTLVYHAYRMLGQYGDAEDVVQDAYLRFSDAVARTAIDDDRPFLRTTVTHLCLDRLRSARAQREIYVGPWLPEPVVTDERADPLASATLADDISFALLLALERLAPLERAAFLLHDVLDVPFSEIAPTLGRSEAAVRQLASRAREHVRDRKRRPHGDRAQRFRVREALLHALETDDPEALARILTDDVVFTSDGGGKVAAATVPVSGRANVSALLRGIARKGLRSVARREFVTLNGWPGMVTLDESGTVHDAIALEIADGRVAALYAIRNPEKLRTVTAQFANR